MFVVLFGVRLWRDPRTFRTGLYMMGAIACGTAAGFGPLIQGLERLQPLAVGRIVAVLALTVAAAVVGLGIVLTLNGLEMVRREGISLAHLLSLLAGLGLLAFLGAWVWTIAANASTALLLLFGAMFPIAYFGVGMGSYLLYGRLYRTIAPWMGALPQAVIVLGAGLKGGSRVTPLLAARLDRAIAIAQRTMARGRDVVIVASGGRGPGESISEATAMAAYLVERGIAPNRVLLEDRSRTTEENLTLSKALLTAKGIDGPVVAVSSNYHVFRTAMLMRRTGLNGYAAGGNVALYYWPSAAIREFAAICAEHLRTTLIGLGLACSPAFVLIGFSLMLTQ
ncbi:MAG: YdcF family protein [Bifidobacteriaceae bacterium]|nr:YdcF family protein [Bifidobacteriaceae bacterium]